MFYSFQQTLFNTLYDYVNNHLFENANCCSILNYLIRASLKVDSSVNSNYELDRFIRRMIKNIYDSIDNKHCYSDICKSEFFYNFSLLTSCFYHNGKTLLPYKHELIDLYRKVFAIDFQHNSQQINLVTSSLTCLFNVLCSTYQLDQQVFPVEVVNEFFDNIELNNRFLVSI